MCDEPYNENKYRTLQKVAQKLYWPKDCGEQKLPLTLPCEEEIERKRIEYALLKGDIVANNNTITNFLVTFIVMVTTIAGVYYKVTGDGEMFKNCLLTVAALIFLVYYRENTKNNNARKYAIKECYYVDYFARVKTLEEKNKGATNTEDLAFENKDDKTGPI